MKNLDLERLTLGEVSTIESLAGMPITAVGDDDKPVGKMLAALVMVTKRRTGFPKFTFNEALALSLPEAHEVLGVDDEDADGDEGDPAAVVDEVPAPKTKTR